MTAVAELLVLLAAEVESNVTLENAAASPLASFTRITGMDCCPDRTYFVGNATSSSSACAGLCLGNPSCGGFEMDARKSKDRCMLVYRIDLNSCESVEGTDLYFKTR